MSSMRNTVQRRNHRERGQPLEREKWGLLEKHKDYSLRAKDYGEKRARLKILRQKAAERNPDEFHYGMLSSKTDRGKKLADRRNPSLSHDAVKLLKTQDLGYLQCMLQKTQKAIERLEQKFIIGEGASPESVEILGESRKSERGQHVILVENAKVQKQYHPPMTAERNVNQRRSSIQVDEYEGMDVEEDTVMRKARHKAEREASAAKDGKVLRKRHRQEQEAQERKLATLRVREKDLRDAVDEVQHQRAKMNGSIGGVTKSGLKWKLRERES